MDEEGNIHFLQYYKTKHSLRTVPEFELPPGETFNFMRGATDSNGKEVRIYIEPRRLTRALVGQGCYFDMISMRSYTEQSVASMMVSVLLTGADISLRGTHVTSSLLYSPDISICTYRTNFDKFLRKVAHQRKYGDDPRNAYINARVTANGRQAVIETDTELHYDEL